MTTLTEKMKNGSDTWRSLAQLRWRKRGRCFCRCVWSGEGLRSGEPEGDSKPGECGEWRLRQVSGQARVRPEAEEEGPSSGQRARCREEPKEEEADPTPQLLCLHPHHQHAGCIPPPCGHFRESHTNRVVRCAAVVCVTQISSAVTEVQEAVLERQPGLAKAMIPVATLHVTLLVTHLADQEQVDLAAAALAQVEPSLDELLGGAELVLPFSGVAHFRNDVVFVALDPGPHTRVLRCLAELLCGGFKERGLVEDDARGFQPHLTIMKLSRAPKLRSQGIKRVDPSLYANYTSRFFGDQTVERLDLCSMLKRKQQDGYYHTETSLQLGRRRRSEPDEAELLRISKRLVEDAVSRALKQYKQESLQNGGGPNAGQTDGETPEAATDDGK
ncbi:A-kinase anchor protein 7-like isoform X3 [Festucalex cinctus]